MARKTKEQKTIDDRRAHYHGIIERMGAHLEEGGTIYIQSPGVGAIMKITPSQWRKWQSDKDNKTGLSLFKTDANGNLEMYSGTRKGQPYYASFLSPRISVEPAEGQGIDSKEPAKEPAKPLEDNHGLHLLSNTNAAGETIYSFVGRVPMSLTYVQSDGSPLTDKQAHSVKRLGPGLLRKQGAIKSVQFTSQDDELAAARQLGYKQVKGIGDTVYDLTQPIKAVSKRTSKPAAKPASVSSKSTVGPKAVIKEVRGELPTEEYRNNVKDSELADWHPSPADYDASWRLVADDGTLIKIYRGEALNKLAMERRAEMQPLAVMPQAVEPETTSGLQTSDLEQINNDWDARMTQSYADEGRTYESVTTDLSMVMKVLQGKTLGKSAMYKIMDQTGISAGLANAYVEQEKERRAEKKRASSFTPRSAGEARVDRIAHTVDSSGRRRARPMGGRSESGKATNVTVRMGKSK